MSDFLLPDIGEGIVECEVVEWLVNEGDRIAEDQPIVEVMTDKALVEITAPEAGVVTRLYVAQGKVARVHAPLYAYSGEGEGEGASEGASEKERQGEDNEQGKEPAKTKAPKKDESAAPSDASASVSVSPKAPHKTPASPAVRRLVREHGLTLDDIDGSGRDGRVLKEDVLACLKACLKESDETNGAQPEPARIAETAAAPLSEPLKGMRAAMAKRMVTSVSTIPHFHYGEEVDVTALLALRERLKEEVAAKGERLTLMPFFMKALALAIDAYPLVNARLDAAAENILYSDGCHIGMAVDGKAGLVVPNVKHVEQRSLFELAQEIGRLTQAAREGRVDAKDMSGGTITISNIGALGGTYAAPIINAPEAAIVAIGKSQWLPRFDAEGAVVRRAIATVTWAGDHRFIDGGTIARFCNAWKAYLEAPDTLLLHLR